MARPKKAKAEAAIVANEGTGVTPGAASPAKLKGKVAGGTAGGWSIFDQEDIVDEQKTLMGYAKNSQDFLATDEVNTEVLPLPWLAMEYVIGRRGIPLRTFTQIIGPEHVSKSSLSLSLAYYFIRNNIPVLYVLSEPKELQSDWIVRLAGEDPRLNRQCAHRVPRVVANSYTDMDNKMRDWVLVARREQKIPFDVPLVIIIDSLSHMRTPTEQEAQASGKKAKEGEVAWSVAEKGMEDVGGRIGSAASFMASWCRLFSEVMTKMNVTVIAISGQSVKLPVGQGPAAMALCSDSNNGESIGGKAIKKAAGIRINMTAGSKLTKGSGELAITYGSKIKMRLLKNSYGPNGNKITFELHNKLFNDEYLPGDEVDEEGDPVEVLTRLDQAIDMDSAFLDACVTEKACGMTCTAGLYTSKELGIERMRASSAMRMIEGNEALKLKVCRALHIAGYEEL